MQKTGIIIGSTGLLGSALLGFLLEDETYKRIKIFVRKPSKVRHEKLEEIIIKDFDELENYQDFMTTDVLFSCLGTRLRKAKTKENYEKIDIQYPIQFAKLAQENACKHFVFMSAHKADLEAKSFFKKSKAKLEKELAKLELPNLQILRPSSIMGDRNEVRINEDFWRVLNSAFPMFVPNSKKPIKVKTVAKFMQLVAFKEGKNIYETYEIRKIEQKIFDMQNMKEETKYRAI